MTSAINNVDPVILLLITGIGAATFGVTMLLSMLEPKREVEEE